MAEEDAQPLKLRYLDEHARTRQQAEAKEGLLSFKEKRKPAWYPEG